MIFIFAFIFLGAAIAVSVGVTSLIQKSQESGTRQDSKRPLQ
jgi:hypothetical protein